MIRTITRFSIILAAFAAIAVALMLGSVFVTEAEAQAPAANLIVSVQLASGSAHPGTQATVTVSGAGVSLGGSPGPSNTLQYSTNFNDTKVVTMWPSSYSVSVASVSGYIYSYSSSCFGTMNSGETRTCTVTATKTGTGSGSAQLIVYTNVINNSGGSLQPNDFTIVVSGNNVNPASFRGQSGGTTVSLNSGTYSADILNAVNYTRSRSNDCSGSISSGEIRTCVITLDDMGSVAGISTSPLTCTPSRQSALLGQTISFVATGGGPVYNWATANRVYLNAGSRLNIVQEGAGTHTVLVTSNQETAVCVVDAFAGTGAVKGISTGPGLPNTGMGGSLALTLLALAVIGGGAVFMGMVGRRGISAILSR